MYNEERKYLAILIGLGIIAVLVLLAILIGFQWFKVFSQEQSGKAELARATWSRQIAVEEARARLESERLNKEAEIIKAEGVSQANRIVADSIDERYVRYLWVKTLESTENQIIYVPTEANIPITEANRLQTPQD